jgi:23S rRNA pseudouridine955/2504/2580 synthase
LQAALRDKHYGAITKIYHALVVGYWPKTCHRVNAPLLKVEVADDERLVRVDKNGKPSLTEFTLLQDFVHCSLVEARPITGRTHQIRVHAKHMGHCLVGDEKYGDDAVNSAMRAQGVKRLFLHAAELSFYLPDVKEKILVSAPLSADLAAVIASLSAAAK